MSDEGYLAAITFSSLFEPILKNLDEDDVENSNRLRNALLNADLEEPGFLLQFVKNLLEKSNLHTAGLNETVLRLQAKLPNDELQTTKYDPNFVALHAQTKQLRMVLARIPDEMVDHRKFIETIRLVGASIKNTLETINNLIASSKSQTVLNIVERGRREFIKSSRKFSTSILNYFHENDKNAVFVGANELIYQISSITESCRKSYDGNQY